MEVFVILKQMSFIYIYGIVIYNIKHSNEITYNVYIIVYILCIMHIYFHLHIFQITGLSDSSDVRGSVG